MLESDLLTRARERPATPVLRLLSTGEELRSAEVGHYWRLYTKVQQETEHRAASGDWSYSTDPGPEWRESHPLQAEEVREMDYRQYVTRRFTAVARALCSDGRERVQPRASPRPALLPSRGRLRGRDGGVQGRRCHVLLRLRGQPLVRALSPRFWSAGPNYLVNWSTPDNLDQLTPDNLDQNFWLPSNPVIKECISNL